jgi:hypothetical protein
LICAVSQPIAEEKFLLNFVSEKLKEVREICGESERQTDGKVWGCE